MKSLRLFLILLAVAFTGGFVSQAIAAAVDTPTLHLVEIRRAQIMVEVEAGASGAPGGFVVEWMKKSEYDALGGWPAIEYDYPVVWCVFDGTPTLTTWGSSPSYLLAPNERALVAVGDAFDETGMWANDYRELAYGMTYVFRLHAEGFGDLEESAYSETYILSTEPHLNDCVFTQGYWKTHGPEGGDCNNGQNPNAWPPFATMTLGTVNYTPAEICAILNTPAAGNGLISLAHQLIATKLNLLNGANPLPVMAFVNAADALIGGLVCPPTASSTDFIHPGTTSALTDDLDDYNNGLSGVPHCGSTATKNVTWGTMKGTYR